MTKNDHIFKDRYIVIYHEKNNTIKLNFYAVLLSFIPKEYSPDDIKMGIPNRPALTTQLYFEGDPYLSTMEDDSLIMRINEENGTQATFNFVIKYYDQYKQ